ITSNHETHLNSNSSLQRNASNQNFQEDKLEAAAREAKQRLHKKLRFQWKLESKRHSYRGLWIKEGEPEEVQLGKAWMESIRPR
ncbi:hypothetical protein IFM89_019912, partial [Coptis chinensis]